MSSLDYAQEPSRVSGGFETDIFRLALSGAPAALSGPLILRVLRPHHNPRQIRIEGAVQNALLAQGYPAPRAVLIEPDPSVLGGAFMLMEHVAGRPLAEGLDIAVSGGSSARVIRLIVDVPRAVARIATIWGEMHARLHALPVGPIGDALEVAGVPLATMSFDGRLAMMEGEIGRLGLTRLEPVIDWLKAHRPQSAVAPVLCHGDFHPLNILAQDGSVTGVLDWGNATFGDPASDVGSTIANISTVPIGVPPLLRPAMRAVIALALRRYRQAYRRHRPYDEAASRYYQVARCTAQLVGAARHAIAGSGAPAGAHHSPAAQANLVRHVAGITGIAVAV